MAYISLSLCCYKSNSSSSLSLLFCFYKEPEMYQLGEPVREEKQEGRTLAAAAVLPDGIQSSSSSL